MRVLVIETNLIWSVRLQRSLVSLGHDAVVSARPSEGDFDVAIVNLGEPGVDWPLRVAELQARGIRVVGHAGHKEKDVLALGKAAGCDKVATNSELTHKLAQVLEAVVE